MHCFTNIIAATNFLLHFKKKSGFIYLQKSLKLYQINFSTLSNSTLHTHTHTPPTHADRHSRFPRIIVSHISPFHVHTTVSSSNFCASIPPLSSFSLSRSQCQWHHAHVAPLPYLQMEGGSGRGRRQGWIEERMRQMVAGGL